MLNKKVLIEKLGKEYEPMINQIKIADFTKCIAQYMQEDIRNVKEDIIEEYLTLWAKNKKHMFEMLGNNIRVDIPIEYIDENDSEESKFVALYPIYPAYSLWLSIFSNHKENKVDLCSLGYSDRHVIESAFPNDNLNNIAITRFFKAKLNAPDDLVTALGQIWENKKIQGTFTISIDPVDIMLASDNPYKWTSCYRLEDNFEECHADGSLAGVIDTATMTTYVWTHKGNFTLYDKYKFSNIRYKRMRMTIAVNNDFTAIHFNTIYPGKSNYSDNLRKLLRDKVETYFATQLNKQNLWRRNGTDSDVSISCFREHSEYGYREYNSYDVYYLVGEENYSDIHPYDTIIHCPCGCKEDFIGTDNEDFCYNGSGLINENFYEETEEDEEEWCNEVGQYVTCEGNCQECPYVDHDNDDEETNDTAYLIDSNNLTISSSTPVYTIQELQDLTGNNSNYLWNTVPITIQDLSNHNQ